MNVKLIDSHCHIDYKKFGNQSENVIIRARNKNIIAIITSTIDQNISKVEKFKNKYKNFLFHSLGLHPPGYTPSSVKTIKGLIEKKIDTIVSIGEVGLDYYWVKDESTRRYQKVVFKEFIELAKSFDKPIVVHSRDAEKDAIQILEDNRAEQVLMHCFSGSISDLRRIIDNGWIISIPTSVVKRKYHQDIAIKCPLENMVLETDAPFLSPDRGLNEPYKVIYGAKKIAELKDTSLEEVAKNTTKNAIKFYSLPI
ncbi:MAG: TatD family hydrolase [Candidatus Helarchaeota archaeon]